VLLKLLLNGEGENGGALNSALLYYQKNKTTKLAWQFYLVIGWLVQDAYRQRCNQYNTQFLSQGFVSTKITKNHIYW
jgi:hypothetical protein